MVNIIFGRKRKVAFWVYYTMALEAGTSVVDFNAVNIDIICTDLKILNFYLRESIIFLQNNTVPL